MSLHEGARSGEVWRVACWKGVWLVKGRGGCGRMVKGDRRGSGRLVEGDKRGCGRWVVGDRRGCGRLVVGGHRRCGRIVVGGCGRRHWGCVQLRLDCSDVVSWVDVWS